MTEDLKGLEEELRRLKPCTLPDSIRDGIRHRLQTQGTCGAAQSPVWAPVRRWGWTLAIAAALGIVCAGAWLVWHSSPRSSVGKVPRRHLAAARQEARSKAPRLLFVTVLIDQRAEGVVMLANDGPAQQIRSRYLDHVQWRDTKRDRLYAMTKPREEVKQVALEVD